MTVSIGTSVRAPAPIWRNRGRPSFGTFTRAKRVCSLSGSRTSTASDSDRLEM